MNDFTKEYTDEKLFGNFSAVDPNDNCTAPGALLFVQYSCI